MPVIHDNKTVPLTNSLLKGLYFLFLILYNRIATNTNQMVMMFAVSGNLISCLTRTTEPVFLQESRGHKQLYRSIHGREANRRTNDPNPTVHLF
jgi:hypothetical protein